MNRLRLQLIGILVLVALLPVLPAAWTARALFRTTLDPFLESTLIGGANAGLAAARARLDDEKRSFEHSLRAGEPMAPFDTLDAEAVQRLDARDQATLAAHLAEPLGAMTRSQQDTLLTAPARVQLRGVETLVARVRGRHGEPVWVTAALPGELVAQVTALSESHRIVQTLRHERRSVLRGLVVTFLAVYGAILLGVLVFGLVLASRLTKPLAALGHGIERVGGGDLSTHVNPSGAGPLQRLVADFNGMIQKLRTQQAELARLERLTAWRQMARRLAHEIKNPLTPIQLAAQQMRDAYAGNDPAYGALLAQGSAIIEEEVESLRELTVTFSEFARMPEPDMAPTTLEELVASVAGLYGDSQLDTHVASGSTSLRCDRGQIRRVLLNLVNNAIDAQRETGRTSPVRLEAESRDRTIVLRVLDRGPGVPTEMRRRIFEPDVTTKSNGMGLGLAIVESTVTAHGGAIDVGDRDGGGAVFTVTLPSDQEKGSS
jgi:nitrogen fixation/metabolism regulation signal transduction histidine kinase